MLKLLIQIIICLFLIPFNLCMSLAYIDVRIELYPHTKDAKYLQKLNRLVYACNCVYVVCD